MSLRMIFGSGFRVQGSGSGFGVQFRVRTFTRLENLLNL